MKYLIRFLAIIIFAMFSCFLVSCGDDDDDDPSNSIPEDYVGTWLLDKKDEWAGGYGHSDGFEYLQFKNDATFIKVQEDDKDAKGYVVSYGTWSVSKKILVLTVNSGVGEGITTKYDVMTKKDKDMMLSVWGCDSYYVKVSDDTINKYLE